MSLYNFGSGSRALLLRPVALLGMKPNAAESERHCSRKAAHGMHTKLMELLLSNFFPRSTAGWTEHIADIKRPRCPLAQVAIISVDRYVLRSACKALPMKRRAKAGSRRSPASVRGSTLRERKLPLVPRLSRQQCSSRVDNIHRISCEYRYETQRVHRSTIIVFIVTATCQRRWKASVLG